MVMRAKPLSITGALYVWSMLVCSSWWPAF